MDRFSLVKARNTLRDRRGKFKLTLAEVTAQTGISAPVLSQMENGQRLPSDEEARLLASLYNVTLSELWELDGPWLAIEPDLREVAA